MGITRTEENTDFYFSQQKSWKCLTRAIHASDKRRYNCKYGKTVAAVIEENENPHSIDYAFSRFNHREAERATTIKRAITAPVGRKRRSRPRVVYNESLKIEGETEPIEWSLENMATLQVEQFFERFSRGERIFMHRDGFLEIQYSVPNSRR